MPSGGRRARRRILGALFTVSSLLLTASAVADPLGEPVKQEIPSPAPGVLDFFDPPLIAQPDPDLLTLPVPGEHPWMLFGGSELPEIRDRILNAPADSVVGQAWQRLLDAVNAPEFTDRDSYVDGLMDLEARNWGRDDLALVAFVWHVAGDDTYLEQAKTLLSYAVAISPDYGAPREPGVDEFYIQRAHRLNGFALAYDLLYPGLDETQRAQLRGIVATLATQHMAHASTAWWGTVSAGSNIGGNNAAALGTAGLALWHEHPDARTWVVRSEQLVRAYFLEGFDREGAGFEGILYGNYGLRIPTYLGHALTRLGHEGFFEAGGLDRQQEWYAYEVLPGGGAVNPVNDARYYEINPTYTTWASSHGDNLELSRWLFDNLTRRVPGRSLGEFIPTLLWYEASHPAFDPSEQLRLAEDFSDRGLVHVRSGWGAEDLMASFEARQSDWGEEVHRNQDVGQFTLYSDGAKLVVDSRYGNWLSKMTAGDFEAARTSESEAHNVVVADGRSQNFWGKGDLVAFATTAELGHPGSVDVALADARLAWWVDQPERAERVFLHVRAQDGAPDYVVVADRFDQGGGEHDYTSYLHTDWRNTMDIDPDDAGRIRIESGEVPGVVLDVTLHVDQPFDSTIGSFTPDDAQDWDRIDEPGRKTHPRLEVTTTSEAYEALAVLIPTAVGESAPAVTRLAANGGIASQVVVPGAGIDTMLLATEDGQVSTAGIETDGIFASVRRGPGGVRHVTLVEGTYVEIDGARLVAFAQPTTVALEF